MASTDQPTPSPRSAFFKLRPKDSRNESSNSLDTSSNSDDLNVDGGTLRPSTSEGSTRFRDRLRRKSVDDRRDSNDSGRRLSTLLSGRRNKLKKTPSTDLEKYLRPKTSNGNLELSGNRSDSSLGLDGSGHSSLLTDDNSDQEG